ncbi:hypothetical protein [Nostoc sp.]|uniref:hypothetical protein n=1 Tax=Nostoc sp. TaxID=1180 RepID=UPI002FF54F8A
MEVKIAKAYIQQGFPDHLAGFYTYLGSIPKGYTLKIESDRLIKPIPWVNTNFI